MKFFENIRKNWTERLLDNLDENIELKTWKDAFKINAISINLEIENQPQLHGNRKVKYTSDYKIMYYMWSADIFLGEGKIPVIKSLILFNIITTTFISILLR
ncbi:MAG: hypothetical protein KAS32_16935 [Candidatus Peribacteraceae bacterium]|nr:hypothetical protein [Candidatus Peribacteraceae bacterium]